MMEKFKQLLMEKAKKGKFLDEKTAKRKLDVLGEVDDLLDGSVASKLRGLKKVTVASDSDEGLKAGLEKAQEKIEEMSDSSEESEEAEENKEAEESEEAEEKMSTEEIKAKIRELQDLLAKEEEE